MNRAWWIAGVIAALVLCLAVGVVVAAASLLVVFGADRTPQPPGVTAAPATLAPPTAAPDPAAETAAPPAEAPTPAVDQATLDMLAEIERQVTELRGLPAQGTFDLQFPTPEEYRQITIDDFSEDYSPEEALDDSRVLTALGLLPDGFDLYTLYVDLYSEGVLGSYDPEAKKMYVLQSSGTLRVGGLERQTYAHEYQHALQDQNYGIEALGLSEEGCEQDSERCSAIRGLIEGDATLLDAQWLEQYGTSQDYADIAEFYSTYVSGAYDRAPCYLRDDFYWPYDDGTAFVQGLYSAGGWASVDEAYRNPPVSSEQIMHLAQYHAGDAPEVIPTPVLTDTLGAGWRQVDANVMGEWYTQLILLEPFREADQASEDYCLASEGDLRQMEAAAAGWGGDAYAVFYADDSTQTVLVLLTTWDTANDAAEFADAFARYGDARFGPAAAQRDGGTCWPVEGGGESCFFRRETDTLWVMAPDAATVDRVVQAIPPFAAP